MKRGITWIVLTCLMVTSLVLASCTTKTTSSTSMSTTTKTTTTAKTTTTTKTTTIPTTTPTTTTLTGNWWDSLGTPQYGGEMSLRIDRDILNFDPFNSPMLTQIGTMWMESLNTNNWAVDPKVFAYGTTYRPSDYVQGQVAESWEFTAPGTLVYHLRQGIHWQNIPPVNGREFTADDVVYSYDRSYGLGNGFTTLATMHGFDPQATLLQSITATDKYTIVEKWKTNNQEVILEAEQSMMLKVMVPREAVQQWGDLNDWHHAIGTGPFILSDFVSGSSATMIKNPNYWGYDERYPQNKLPYVDKVTWLIIPDQSTAMAALRAGKIDVMEGLPLQTAQSMKKTNPEILQIAIPANATTTIDLRNDVKPFNDIRVREALQMAIDLPSIAQTYYGGYVLEPNATSETSTKLKGWAWPYNQWPQDLKDQYTYNPTAAKQLLASAGYSSGFDTNIVVDSAVDMSLLQIVKSSFSNIGVNMTIRPMDYGSWVSFVLTNHKHDQIAQRTGGRVGNASEPMNLLTTFRTGGSANYMMVSDPVYDAFYTTALAATNVSDIKQININADKYVAQQHFVICLLTPDNFAFCQPWLKGYNGQVNALSGGGTGPLIAGYYTARFWIDQNLKKPTGH